jgi:hypothetical protein
MTSGVWLINESKSDNPMKWDHPIGSEDTIPWSGMTLITDSGVFKVLLDSPHGSLVRDFTEVGFSRLPETYTRVESVMISPDHTVKQPI